MLSRFRDAGFNGPLWLSLFALAALYASISLVNHFCFRTSAFDLGIYNQAVYSYAHFQPCHSSILEPRFRNVLTDHLAGWPMIVSPLWWLFGGYTLLFAQLLAFLLGAAGVYRLTLLEDGRRGVALSALWFFGCFWGIGSALASDYHDNSMAIGLTPWFLLAFRNQNWRWLAVLTALLLITKETMPVWVISITAGAALLYARNLKAWGVAAGIALLSAAYFWLATRWAMPMLYDQPQEYVHLKYRALGANAGEWLETLFKNPARYWHLLFVSHDDYELAKHIKTELHLAVFASGGLVLFLRPAWLLMLLPVYAQKLYHDQYTVWGVNYHYGLEFAPVLALALFTVRPTWLGRALEGWRRGRIKGLHLWCGGWLAASLLFHYSIIGGREALWYTPERLKFWSAEHYAAPVPLREARNLLAAVPDDVPVSANYNVVPHLADRDTVYQYPVVENAQFILLLDSPNETYPMPAEELRKQVKELSSSGKWTLVLENSAGWLFRRAAP